MVKVGNKMTRARQYPWGMVMVDNEAHSDFVKLREMLLRTNMQDLIEKTHYQHYELYRRNRLVEMGFSDSLTSNGKSLSISETYEAKLTELKAEIQKKEDEIKETFVAKVKAKEAELKEAEKEVIKLFKKKLFESNFNRIGSILSCTRNSLCLRSNMLNKRNEWKKRNAYWRTR